MIPHSRPTLGKDDERAILNAVRYGQVAQGKTVGEFERKFASFACLKGGVAVSSGTAALHLSLVALGVKRGDEVIIPAYTCAALLNAVNYVCAEPVLADVNRNDYNISFSDAKKKLTKRTKAIIVPHMFGCPVEEITKIVRLGVPVIEDCAQAIGAVRDGRMAGTFGTLSIFSFYATKVMTTGEGGMVLSDCAKLLEKMRDLRDYDEKTDYKVRYNYKMTDMQAGLGLSQLKKLPGFIRKRKEIASIYSRHFSCFRVRIPEFHAGHIYFRYVIEIEKGSVEKCLKETERAGVKCRRPVFEPLYRCLQLKEKEFSNTGEAFNRSVSIPIYPSLTGGEIEKIINTVQRAT